MRGVGDLLTWNDANNHLTTYGYDLARRRTSETKPLNRVWTYAYDAANNRTQVVDAFGNSTQQTGDGTTTFTFDDLNRLSGITYSDGTHAVTYEYYIACRRHLSQLARPNRNLRLRACRSRRLVSARAASPRSGLVVTGEIDPPGAERALERMLGPAR